MSGGIGGDEIAVGVRASPNESDQAWAEYRTPEMVLSHRMERSILDASNLSDFVPFAVGDRKRYAICSTLPGFRALISR